MRISDWSSDVCSSDLLDVIARGRRRAALKSDVACIVLIKSSSGERWTAGFVAPDVDLVGVVADLLLGCRCEGDSLARTGRSEEHTSELQSLMRNSYAVFCLKKKIKLLNHNTHKTH